MDTPTHKLFLRVIGVFCFLALFNLNSSYGQRYIWSDSKYVGKFKYPRNKGERTLKTWYHYVVSQNKGRYIVRTFFPETGVLTSYKTYVDRKLSKLEGPFMLISDDQRATITGTYKNGFLHGHWESVSDSITLEVGNYDHGLKVGKWNTYYTNGNLKSFFTYDGGEELGEYAIYDTTGTIIDKGNSILNERYSSLPPAEYEAKKGRHIIDEYPCFGECNPNLSISQRAEQSRIAVSQYLQQKLVYPDSLRALNIYGRVNASVLIDKNGLIKDIRIVNGLCEPIAQVCRQTIMSMPKWTPGRINGKKADVRVLVPFGFRGH